MVNRKPKGWSDAFEDAIPFIRQGRSKTVPKSAKKAVKSGAKAMKTVDKAVTGAAKYALGDPKKGVKDVALNTGSWFVPYGKGAKVINKGVNAVVKGKKTAKVVRGAAKTAGVVGVGSAMDKASQSKKKNVKSRKK